MNAPAAGGAPAPPPTASAAATTTQMRDQLLVGLTFAAGLVDAVSYLGLGQIFTANMTGNLVFLALAVGQGSLFPALRSVDALAGFCLGATLAGRLLGAVRGPDPWPSRVTRVLALQLVLMGAFAVGWVALEGRPTGDPLYLLIGLSSLGMGLQNAAVRHLAVPGLTTTVITSALTGLMAEFAALGISGPNQRRWAVAVAALFGGAAVGAALLEFVRFSPPLVTVGILAAVCLIAYVRVNRAATAADR